MKMHTKQTLDSVIYLRVKTARKEQLQAIANEREIPLTLLMNEIIREYLEKQEG